MLSSSVVPHLTGIIEAIEPIREKPGANPLEAVEKDWEQQWIVQRGIEIVSYASRHLSEPIKARYPDIRGEKLPPLETCCGTITGRFRRRFYWEIVQDHLAPLSSACRAELERELAAERDET